MRFRRVTSVVLVALIGSLLSYSATPAHAAYDPLTGNGTVTCGGGGTFTITSNTVSGHSACTGSISIPESVTAIAQQVFWTSNGAALTSVSLPSTLTTIDNFAFWSQPLRSITIPASVTLIGLKAFSDSTLETVTFLSGGSSPLSIGSDVFYNSRITSITFPARLSALNVSALAANAQLQSIDFLGNAPDISGGTFNTLGSPRVTYTAAATGFTAPTWGGLNVSPPQCAPTSTQSGSRTVLTFTNTNNPSPCSWSVPADVSSLSLLVVGGGGGGGRNLGGGGGGGGLYYNDNKSVTASSSVTVAVGAGGVGGNPGGGSIALRNAANGSQSSFAEIISQGGGAGGDLEDGQQIYNGASGGVGASGGGGFWGFSGGSGSNSSPYRFGSSGANGAPNPGTGAGGGGGGGGAGAVGVGDIGGAGGVGKEISISGSAVFYAGGGGGTGGSAGGAGGNGGGASGNICGVSPDPGLPNTGGGGGGYRGCGDTRGGSTGGSGVVIVSYLLTAPVSSIVLQPAIPDPIQKSRIDTFTASSLEQRTDINILGSFVEGIKNIQLNGINMAQGAWTQTLTSITLTLTSLKSGIYEIQIYNGSSPALKPQTFKIAERTLPATTNLRVRKKLITCVKGFNQKLIYSVNPVCPVDFKKKQLEIGKNE